MNEKNIDQLATASEHYIETMVSLGFSELESVTIYGSLIRENEFPLEVYQHVMDEIIKAAIKRVNYLYDYRT